MKKTLILLLCLLSFSVIQAQTPLFNKIKTLLQEQYPAIDVSDKLIAYNTWQLEDASTREKNEDFDKAHKIYHRAKLKGGTKGIVVVSVLTNGSLATAKTTLAYDGCLMLIPLDFGDLRKELTGAPQNMVFDAEGQEVYRNLEAGQVAASINKLITR